MIESQLCGFVDGLEIRVARIRAPDGSVFIRARSNRGPVFESLNPDEAAKLARAILKISER